MRERVPGAWCVLVSLVFASCGGEGPSVGTSEHALSAYCSVSVAGRGTKKMETDYLPHVVACENGAAGTEALKAQAVAARTFAYYKKASLRDGQSDQVYTCAAQPQQKHFDAVKATSGEVLVYKGKVICSFYVAGAKPSTTSCVASHEPGGGGFLIGGCNVARLGAAPRWLGLLLCLVAAVSLGRRRERGE